jgi:hypothetical protein
MKQRFNAAASSSVSGGTKRLLTAPLMGAFAITTTACEAGATFAVPCAMRIPSAIAKKGISLLSRSQNEDGKYSTMLPEPGPQHSVSQIARRGAFFLTA